MKKITILIKPVSSACNMICDYCFYKDISQYRKSKICIMSETTVNAIINKFIDVQNAPINIEFCFQGGEPLLAGIDFYKYFILTVNKKNKGHSISYSIQTNGTLINEEWIELFKVNRFLVGVSLDGIEEVHDYYRKDSQQGTYKQIVANILLLQENKIDFNILSVITSRMSIYAKEIYELYKKQLYNYVQFIPCLPFYDKTGGLKPREYARFYKELFDIYINDKSIQIDLFEQIFLLRRGIKNCSCGMLGYCSFQIVIEANGDVFPCDFYATDEYCLGNISDIDLKSTQVYKCVKTFLMEDKDFSYLCEECEYFEICQGQCKRQNICLFNDEYCGYQDLLRYIDRYEIAAIF